MKTSILFFTLFILSVPAFAQDNKEQYKQDASSIDDIVKALYEVISGPAGQRDWDRFYNLFDGRASMAAVFPNKKGEIIYRSFTPAQYIAKNDTFFLKNAFYEKEIHRTVEQFKNLAQVFSTYEFTETTSKQKGINSLQLIFYNDRWWIASIIWEQETPDNLLPEKYK